MTFAELDEDEPPPARGMILEAHRGSWPFALLHGEPLVACAAWALGASGVVAVDLGTPWEALAEAGEPLVLHDPLCPMTPPQFLAACVREAVEHDAVVVGVRPVTDTVKRVEDGLVAGTVDREGLLQVASPVVLPASVVAALDGLPDDDLAALTALLARRWPVRTLTAPAQARRVGGPDDLALLEALTGPGSAEE